MANTDKDILITPNNGSSSADPKIEFKGADASTSAQTITATAYPTNNGTLSFDGSAGQLFSITNDMTGTIFSVNDVSGIPSIEVEDDGTIRFAEYSGNVGIGEASPSYKLHVNDGLTTTVYATGDGGTNSYAEFVAYNPDDGAGHAGATARLRSYGWGEGYLSIGGFNIMQQGGRMNINNSGQTLYINAANVGIGNTSPSQKFVVSENTDTSAIIGRAHVGYVGHSDYAGFSHMDQDGQYSYALLQFTDGMTYLNAPSGKTVNIRNNNNQIITAAGGYIDIMQPMFNYAVYYEDYDSLSGTSVTITTTNAQSFSLTMSGNTTFTFTNPSSAWGYSFVLEITGNGGTITWPSSVDWAGGTAPAAPASGETDIYVFYTRDGGTTWRGALAIDAAA